MDERKLKFDDAEIFNNVTSKFSSLEGLVGKRIKFDEIISFGDTKIHYKFVTLSQLSRKENDKIALKLNSKINLLANDTLIYEHVNLYFDMEFGGLDAECELMVNFKHQPVPVRRFTKIPEEEIEIELDKINIRTDDSNGDELNFIVYELYRATLKYLLNNKIKSKKNSFSSHMKDQFFSEGPAMMVLSSINQQSVLNGFRNFNNRDINEKIENKTTSEALEMHLAGMVLPTSGLTVHDVELNDSLRISFN